MGPLNVGWWTDHERYGDEGRRRLRRTRGQRRAADLDQPTAMPAKAGASEGAGLADAASTAAPGIASEHGTSDTGAHGSVADRRTPTDRRSGSTSHSHGRTSADRIRRPPTAADRVRTAVRGLGQTLITLGLVVLLFVVYELWVTDLINHRTQRQLGATLHREWESGDDPLVGAARSGPRRPREKVTRIPLGRGIANIYIPAFGTDYVFTIVEGTSTAQLEQGPGHYVDSALPGGIGNFSVAGHRVGKGSPFLNLDKLRAGAAIVIETKDYWYTYRVMGSRETGDPEEPGNGGIRGMQVVEPTNIGVIRPVPGRSGGKPRMRLLTLTTCHPKFSARERLIIHAQQEGGPLSKSRGLPPALKG
jgi:sortase A